MMRKKGFTLVEIMIVVAIIGLLAAIAIPNFVRARSQAQLQACVANMRQIEGAEQVSQLDGNAANTTVPGTLVTGGYLMRAPVCQAGGTYAIAADGTVTCNAAVTPAHVLQ